MHFVLNIICQRDFARAGEEMKGNADIGPKERDKIVQGPQEFFKRGSGRVPRMAHVQEDGAL